MAAKNEALDKYIDKVAPAKKEVQPDLPLADSIINKPLAASALPSTNPVVSTDLNPLETVKSQIGGIKIPTQIGNKVVDVKIDTPAITDKAVKPAIATPQGAQAVTTQAEQKKEATPAQSGGINWLAVIGDALSGGLQVAGGAERSSAGYTSRFLEQQREKQAQDAESKAKLAEIRAKYFGKGGSPDISNIKLSSADKNFVDTLATKNANKVSIANALEAGYKTLSDPKISDVQKMETAKGMLKTLNSPEGADAIGAEEAKRLGALLQPFSISRKFESGAPIFGVQMKEFGEQLRGGANRIKESVNTSNQQIADVYKRYGATTGAPTQLQETKRVYQEGDTIVNRQTGARKIFKNGQWVDIK